MDRAIEPRQLALTRNLVDASAGRIGALLVDAGKLSLPDAEAVLRLQREKGLRFGEAAVQLGLVSEADIQQILAKQFDYPVVVAGASPLSPEVVAAFDPSQAAVEAFRAIRSQLMLRWFAVDGATKAIAIVSPGRGEGRSFLAANLAVVFSQLGERTLLIDADLRAPRQHLLFGVANREGLSTVLSERATTDVVQPVAGLVSLAVLPAGPIPPNPQELLARPVFSRFLEDVKRDFDIVILDTSAATTFADAQSVASACRGAVLVARKNRTRLNDLQDLALGLRAAKVEVVGAALNER
jgi:chain length determinant protein tyrosine kinase EpsG